MLLVSYSSITFISWLLLPVVACSEAHFCHLLLSAPDRMHMHAGEGIADGEQDHLFSLAGLKVRDPVPAAGHT